MEDDTLDIDEAVGLPKASVSQKGSKRAGSNIASSKASWALVGIQFLVATAMQNKNVFWEVSNTASFTTMTNVLEEQAIPNRTTGCHLKRVFWRLHVAWYW